MVVAVAVAAIVIVVVVVALLASRRRADPVDSFRRQIDALSPEARRPTISQASPADDTPSAGAAALADAPDGDAAVGPATGEQPLSGDGLAGEGETDDDGPRGSTAPGGPDGT